MPQISHKRPSNCSEAELDTFETFVKQGSEVTSQGLRERILRAEWLVFAVEEDGTFSGISALKKPNDSYKRNIFRKAGTQLNPDDFPYEAGWLFVPLAFRGKKYSRLLLEKVIGLAGEEKLYATTRANNDFMRRTNRRCGLVDTGSPYASEDGDYNLVLSVHQRQAAGA
jgi:GNAT superfamily N-acetyltransferase